MRQKRELTSRAQYQVNNRDANMEQNKILRDLDISEHDRHVLESIFNPYQIGGNAAVSDVAENFTAESEQTDSTTTTTTVWSDDVIRFELEAIRETEQTNYVQAIEIYDKIIELAPLKSSIYNNRGQTYRLMGNDEAALQDINRALELTNNTGNVACNAFCQRGILKRKNNDDDGARDDFNSAAKMGSKFARNQVEKTGNLVELNPYAALCNQMLKQTFEKLS